MKTVLEIVQKHFYSAKDDIAFREWAFGVSNLREYSNTQLINLWNMSYALTKEKFVPEQELIYVVMQMIYYWNVRNRQGFIDTAKSCDEMIAKEKIDKKCAPVPEYIRYTEYTNHLKENIKYNRMLIDEMKVEIENLKKKAGEQSNRIDLLKNTLEYFGRYLPTTAIKW